MRRVAIAPTIALALVSGACGRRREQAPPERSAEPATTRIAVVTDGKDAPAVSVPGDGLDVWTLCDTHGAFAIEASGAGGTYVHGDCAHRTDYSFKLIAGAAELRRRTDDTVVTRATGISTIAVQTAAAAALAARPPPRLHLDVDGETHEIALAELADDEAEEGTRRRGAELRAALVAANVALDQIVSITIHGRQGDYAVDPAWLQSKHDDLRIRLSNKGELRFGHERDGAPVDRRSDVTSIEVHLRRAARNAK